MTLKTAKLIKLFFVLIIGTFFYSCTVKEVSVSPIVSIPDYVKTVTNPASSYEKELDSIFLRSFNNAWSKLQGGSIDEAAEIFQEILKAKPGFYPAHVALGYISMIEEKQNKAMRHFNSALSLKKDYLPALLGLGALYRVMGENLEAFNVYALILEKYPRQPEARLQYDIIRLQETDKYLLLARAYRKDGRFDPALENYKKALNYIQNEDFLFEEVGNFLVENKMYGQAVSYLQRAVDLKLNNASYLKTLGLALERSGKPSDARIYYKKALDLTPNDALLRSDIERVTKAAQRIKTGEKGKEIQSQEKITRAAAAVYLYNNFPFHGEPAKENAEIITDIIEHLDNLAIIEIVKRGIFEVYTDHTFAPNKIITRLDLAVILDRLIKDSTDAGTTLKFNPRGVRIEVSDISINTPSYSIVNRVVTLGLMALQEERKFNPIQPITGREFVLAIDRLVNLLESED